eukprot:scaffold51470_cov53-Phaeocystis_antarctica.AAC.2
MRRRRALCRASGLIASICSMVVGHCLSFFRFFSWAERALLARSSRTEGVPWWYVVTARRRSASMGKSSLVAV